VLVGLLTAPEHGAAAATGRPPVIVIPGLAGSEFTAASNFSLSVDNGHGGTYSNSYSAGERVWVNTFQIALPGNDDYLDALKLQPDGVTPVAPAVQVSNIYGGAYGDLIDYLQRKGYTPGYDLWAFPYDWRQDVRTIADQLDGMVTQALVVANGGQTNPATWTVRRVDLVAHSLGGLVARAYIADPDRANRVDQLLTLGGPQLGAPKLLKALVYGDQFGPWFLGIGLNPSEVRDLAHNMTAGLQLLPSRAYDRLYDNSDSTRLRPWVEDRDIDGDGAAEGVLDYDQTLNVLRNLGNNAGLLALTQRFHDGLDDQTNGGVNGVHWSALVGYSYGTLGQIREYTGSCLTWWWYQPCSKRDEIPVDGDGTVPVLSGVVGDPWFDKQPVSGAEITYIDREHTALVKRDYDTFGNPTGDGSGLAWVGATLAQGSATAASQPESSVALAESANPTVASGRTAPARAGATPPPSRLNGDWISALGPVAMQINDSGGRLTGRTRGSDAETLSMPDTTFDQLPDAQFAFVKHAVPYTIALQAERAGSVDLKVRALNNGRVERTAVYLGIGLQANGRARLAIRPGARQAAAPAGWPRVEVDMDGDGIFETSMPPAAVLDAVQSVDTRAPELVIDSPATARAVGGHAVVRWHATDRSVGIFTENAVLDPETAPRKVANGEALTLSPGQHKLLVVVVDRAGNARGQEVTLASP